MAYRRQDLRGGACNVFRNERAEELWPPNMFQRQAA